MFPTVDVLSAFGISGNPRLLEGGEGTTYVAGNVVLKPVASEIETNWRSNLLSSLPQVGFRIARSLKTIDGNWTCEGWEASTFVEGQPTKSRWKEKIEVSRKFHAQLQNIDKPAFIDLATHPWAISDRMVWGEQPLEYSDRLKPVMQQLEAMTKPVTLPSQLIHGDMTGNILFHDSLDPAVIDFSPYWRPAEYATAIIIVDSIVWDGVDQSLLLEMENRTDMNQLLIRATMWRIKTTEEYIKQYGKGLIDHVDAYQPLIKMLEARVW